MLQQSTDGPCLKKFIEVCVHVSTQPLTMYACRPSTRMVFFFRNRNEMSLAVISFQLTTQTTCDVEQVMKETDDEVLLCWIGHGSQLQHCSWLEARLRLLEFVIYNWEWTTYREWRNKRTKEEQRRILSTLRLLHKCMNDLKVFHWELFIANQNKTFHVYIRQHEKKRTKSSLVTHRNIPFNNH